MDKCDHTPGRPKFIRIKAVKIIGACNRCAAQRQQKIEPSRWFDARGHELKVPVKKERVKR